MGVAPTACTNTINFLVSGLDLLGVDEDDTGELLETVPEGLTNVELLELEQECTTEEEEREKETAEEKEPLRKFTVKGLAKDSADLNKLLKKFENMDPNTKRFSLMERNVHGALSAYMHIYYEKQNQANHNGQISEKTDTSRRASGRTLGRIPEDIVIIGDDSSMQVIAPKDPPVGHDVEVEDSDIDDPEPV